jgi:hypothetical protein
MTKPKVFCRDCKHYKCPGEWDGYECYKLMKIVPRYNEGSDQYHYWGVAENAKGDCPHFELKWYKKIFKCFRRGNYD